MGDFEELASRIKGDVITPSSPGYEDSRKIWSGLIDKRPRAIVECASADDVAEAVRFAAAEGWKVSTRGGGHNVAGSSMAGDIVLDLSSMRSVTVDPQAKRARVQGGALLGDIDAATQKHALAVPVGVVSETGIGGLCLNGGMGFLRNKWGLTCDNLVSAEIVTGDARILTASETSEPDLFWALRGGGGSFGGVTTFEFALHPVGPDVASAVVFYPAERYQEIAPALMNAVDELLESCSPLAFFGHVPPAEFFPEEHHGRPFLAVVGAYAGDPEEGESILQPLRNLGPAIADLSGVLPFVELQKMFDEDYPVGKRYYWKSINLDKGLEASALDVLAKGVERAPSPDSTIDIWFQGGAMASVATDASAFGDRSHPILIGVEANWDDPSTDAAQIAWAREVVTELEQFTDAGAYLNFAGSEEEQPSAAQSAYGANFGRLVEIKKTYDPAGVFASNLI